MQINATFLIQIINFWVTYFVLHKLFFKPSIQLIDKKKAAKAAVLEHLKVMNTDLLLLQDAKKKHLENFKLHIKSRYAKIPLVMHKIPDEVVITKNEEEIDALVQTTKAILIKKVPYVY